MAAYLQDKFDAKVDLLPGDKGVFEVTVDGRLVFSKGATGRFPEDDEIGAQLRA